jgi:hypothetical protein
MSTSKKSLFDDWWDQNAIKKKCGIENRKTQIFLQATVQRRLILCKEDETNCVNSYKFIEGEVSAFYQLCVPKSMRVSFVFTWIIQIHWSRFTLQMISLRENLSMNWVINDRYVKIYQYDLSASLFSFVSNVLLISYDRHKQYSTWFWVCMFVRVTKNSHKIQTMIL